MSLGRLFVTGATGLVGRALARVGLEQGWELTVLCREPDRLPVALARAVDLAVGDFQAVDVIRPILPGCRAVLNAAGVLRSPAGRPAFEEGNILGPLRLLEAAAAAGVPMVHVSSAGVYGRPRGRLLTEGCPLEQQPERRGVYTATKLEGEWRLRRRARELGATLAVVRPGVVYGPGAAVPEGRLAARLPGGALALLGSPSTPFSVTHADHLADALLLLAAAPRRGIWNVADDSTLTQSDWRRARRVVLAGGRTAFYVPLPMALALVRPLAALGRGRNLPYRLRRSLAPFALDGTKLRRETGWRPRRRLLDALRCSGPGSP